MQNQLKKAIELARKTGDRLMVFESPESVNAYVLLPVDDYGKMVKIEESVGGLTEIELIDKINRDIAIWKSEQNFDEEYMFSHENKVQKHPEHISKAIEERQKKTGWNIPKQRKEKATEIEE